MSCARCHDHKFDPIPQIDYYSLAGIFTSCKLSNVPLGDKEMVKRIEEVQAKIKKLDGDVKEFMRVEKTERADGEGRRPGSLSRGRVEVSGRQAEESEGVAERICQGGEARSGDR